MPTVTPVLLIDAERRAAASKGTARCAPGRIAMSFGLPLRIRVLKRPETPVANALNLLAEERSR
jgi:hypothetical protein